MATTPALKQICSSSDPSKALLFAVDGNGRVWRLFMFIVNANETKLMWEKITNEVAP